MAYWLLIGISLILLCIYYEEYTLSQESHDVSDYPQDNLKQKTYLSSLERTKFKKLERAYLYTLLGLMILGLFIIDYFINEGFAGIVMRFDARIIKGGTGKEIYYYLTTIIFTPRAGSFALSFLLRHSKYTIRLFFISSICVSLLLVNAFLFDTNTYKYFTLIMIGSLDFVFLAFGINYLERIRTKIKLKVFFLLKGTFTHCFRFVLAFLERGFFPSVFIFDFFGYYSVFFVILIIVVLVIYFYVCKISSKI